MLLNSYLSPTQNFRCLGYIYKALLPIYYFIRQKGHQIMLLSVDRVLKQLYICTMDYLFWVNFKSILFCATTGYFLTFFYSLLKDVGRRKEEWSSKTGFSGYIWNIPSFVRLELTWFRQSIFEKDFK